METGASFDIPPWGGSRFHCSQLRRFPEEINYRQQLNITLFWWGFSQSLAERARLGGGIPPETRDWKVRRKGNLVQTSNLDTPGGGP